MDVSPIYNQLSSSPILFPGCCLAISRPLITHLATLLPQKPNFTISIGSGTGLLEALTSHSNPNLTVEGVEVDSTINRYIAEEEMSVVGGGWALHDSAQHATAWLFVYPRDPRLIPKYIDAFKDGAVETIVWLGPRVDWPDYEMGFRGSVFSHLGFLEIGLAPYEMMVVARREGQVEGV